MPQRKGRNTVVIDGYTRFCLTAIVALLTVLIIGLWATGPASLTGAGIAAAAPRAAVRDVLPNAGAQRQQMLRAIQAGNQKLQRIADLLASGKVRVTVEALKLSPAPPPAPSKGAAGVKVLPVR